jgi:hypothetical protein
MPAGPVVTLYGRAGCHLCDEALLLLRSLAPPMGFRVEQVDVESDSALLERYVFDIPVIVVGESEVARAPISARALEDALAEILSAPHQPGLP